MPRHLGTATLVTLLATLLTVTTGLADPSRHGPEWSAYEWTLISEDTGWEARAGLQVVELRDKLYLMGGRTPRPPVFPPIIGDSDIWGDV